ncbi:MAG: hypothetical protein IJ695_01990 [Butyrivibrio sp.]|nr:hypothetical protein [Butyrivibrio sp.]
MDQSVPTLQLSLISHAERPTFSYIRNNIEILAMYDSGAVVPVWCASEKALLKAYPNAELDQRKGFISGFGKDKQECKIYKIPEFELSEGDKSYKIENLYIAACKRPQIGCTLIMSETMFSKTDTFIKRRNRKFLELYFDKDKFQCTLKYFSEDKFSIAIWAQEE